MGDQPGMPQAKDAGGILPPSPSIPACLACSREIPDQEFFRVPGLKATCDLLSETTTLVIPAPSLLFSVKGDRNDVIHASEGRLPAQLLSVPGTQAGPYMFLSAVLEAMQHPLYDPPFNVIQECTRLYDPGTPIEYAVCGVFLTEVKFGEGHFISTKCTQELLSPI